MSLQRPFLGELTEKEPQMVNTNAFCIALCLLLSTPQALNCLLA